MFNWLGRRVKSSTLFAWISIVSLAGGVWLVRAQTLGTNAPARATGFSLPYKKEGRTVALFTGADNKPLSVTAVQIRDFRVETYQLDGTPNLQGTAPECHLDISTRKITSKGPLNVTQAGGAFTLTGVGFTWDQEGERLQLSNQVHATFRLSSKSSPLFNRP